MNISKIIERVPDSVKVDIIDFKDVILKDNSRAIRVTVDRLLTTTEKIQLKRYKKIVGVDCFATYRHAPEIKKSYFYIKY